MRILIILTMLLATVAVAEPDYKNVAIGAGSYGVTRAFFALAIEPKYSEGENYWAKAVGAGCASAAIAGCAGMMVEGLPSSDTTAEADRDMKARLYGAALAFGMDMVVRTVWYIFK